MPIAEQQIWPDPGVCPCVFAATCAWSCAASRRWTAARWRAPCWGLTSKTPKPERSSWCFHRRSNKFHSSLYSSTHNTVNYQRICVSLETKSTSKTAGSGCLNQDPSLGLTSKHRRLMNFSPAAEIIGITGNVRLASSGAFSRFLMDLMQYHFKVWDLSVILKCDTTSDISPSFLTEDFLLLSQIMFFLAFILVFTICWFWAFYNVSCPHNIVDVYV